MGIMSSVVMSKALVHWCEVHEKSPLLKGCKHGRVTLGFEYDINVCMNMNYADVQDENALRLFFFHRVG